MCVYPEMSNTFGRNPLGFALQQLDEVHMQTGLCSLLNGK